jgi:hypothetical protein
MCSQMADALASQKCHYAASLLLYFLLNKVTDRMHKYDEVMSQKPQEG